MLNTTNIVVRKVFDSRCSSLSEITKEKARIKKNNLSIRSSKLTRCKVKC